MHSRRKGQHQSSYYDEDILERDDVDTGKLVKYSKKTKYTLGLCLIASSIRFIYYSHLLCWDSRVPEVKRDVVSSFQISPETQFYTNSEIGLRKCSTSLSEINSQNDVGLHVIAYAGDIKDNHPGYKNFITSLSLAGYKSVVIKSPAENDKEILNAKGRPNYTAEAQFWVNRLREFHRTATAFLPDDILIFCDAFDVIFGLSPPVFLSRFESLKSDVVFSTEMLCDTVSCRRDMELTDWFSSISPNPRNPYKFLNAGMLAGRAAAVAEFMKCAISYAVSGRDDQTAFAFCFRDFRVQSTSAIERDQTPKVGVRVTLDYFSLLFGNLPPVDSLFAKAWDMNENRHLDNFHSEYENNVEDGNVKSGQASLHTIPFLYRVNSFSHPLLDKWGHSLSPVMVHVPGMAYRPVGYSLFNPCQQFLKWRYNQLGVSFEFGLPPNIFHPYPSTIASASASSKPGVSRESDSVSSSATVISDYNRSIHFRNYLNDFAGDTMASVVLCGVFSISQTSRGDLTNSLHSRIRNFLTDTIRHNKVVVLSTVYIVISMDKKNWSGAWAPMFSSTIILGDLAELLQDFSDVFRLEFVCYVEGGEESGQGNAEGKLEFGDSDNGMSSSVLNQVLAMEADPSTRLVVVWVRESSPLQDNFVDVLHRQQRLLPGSAVGFGGWIIDIDSSDKTIPIEKLHLRSASKWVDVGVVSVDVLDFSGVIFERRMFGMRVDEEGLLSNTHALQSSSSRGNSPGLCLHSKPQALSEEVKVSAMLSSKGIPRFALPIDISRTRPISASASASASEVKYKPSLCHLLPLLPYFQMSWVSPSKKEVNNAECSAILDKKFRPIPVVDNLPGFSWQSNWDADSATSPCTTHLMTRIVSGVSLMGVGQYINEGQVLRAPAGEYELEFEKEAMFCLYEARRRDDTEHASRSKIGCLGPPPRPQKTACGDETEHYAAIMDGELCVFCGNSPGIGSSRSESGHGPIEWCTSDSYPTLPTENHANQSRLGQDKQNYINTDRRQLGGERVLHSVSEKSDRMAAIKARIREKISAVKAAKHSEQVAECHRRDHFPKEQWEYLYLHAADDGLFGLYIGNSIDIHELSDSKLRAHYLQAGRCFNVGIN